MSFISIIGIGLCGFVIAGLVKQFNPSFSVYVSVGAAIVLTVLAFSYFQPVISFLESFATKSGIGGYADIIIRLTAIGAVTSIAADICSDSGENAIASRIELAGKGAAAFTILPVLENLLVSVREFLM
ncbi:MAG: hypothetical protein IKI97_11340 [Clostridia bacterium]|nr:hypothetical protein [Clostridia bacterium]